MSESNTPHGFIGRQHHKIRFTDVSEFFIARLLLLKAPEPRSSTLFECSLTLLDIFPQFREFDTLCAHLVEQEIDVTERENEQLADLMTSLSGVEVEETKKIVLATEFYNDHLETKLSQTWRPHMSRPMH